MTILIPVVAVSPLRQRLIDEMDIRRFGPERVRRYAPPITVPARVRIGKDLRSLANEDLAMPFKNCRTQVAAPRVALRAAVVERARKLAVIHRERLGME